MADFQTTVELRAQTGQLTQKLNQTERQLRQVSTQVRKTQGAFTKMGRKVTGTFTKMNNKIKEHRAAIAGIGISLGLVVAKGVKDFKEWEDGLAQIATLGVTGIKGISDELDKVRREFGISGAEATKGYYDIISAGASQGAEAMGQLTAATKLAKAGNTDLAGAIDVVTSGINIFGDNGETAASITDKLFLAVKYGKTTVEELGKTFGFVAPVVDAAGLSMADYAASMATITAGGIQTKQATTGLKAVMSNLIKVTPKAAKKAKELGIEFNTTALKSKGLVGVMKEIAEKTGGNVDELGHLFDSIEAINAVAVLTSEGGLKNLERNFNAMSDAAGTTEEALEKVKATASYNFAKFNQGMSIMSRSIGASVVPSLLNMADALAPVVDFISALITKHPGIIKVTAAVVALAAALAFLGGPVTLAIVGVGVALKKLSDHFDLFADGGVAALEKIELVWDNFWAGFKNKNLSEILNDVFVGSDSWVGKLLPEGGWDTLWTDTKNKLTVWWVQIDLWFQTTDWAGLWDNTIQFTGTVWGGIKKALTAAWDGITTWFTTRNWSGLWYGTGPHGRGLLEFGGDIWQSIKDALAAAWTGITNWFANTDWSGIWNNTIQFTGSLWGGIKSLLDAVYTGATGWAAKQDWKGIWDNTIQFSGSVWSSIKSLLDSAYTGSIAWAGKQDWSGLWDNTIQFTGSVWAGVKEALGWAWAGSTEWAKSKDWTGMWDNTIQFTGDIWSNIKTKLDKASTGIITWFSETTWGELWGDTLNYTGDIWLGVSAKLSETRTGIKAWFKDTTFGEMWGDTLDYTGDIWASISPKLTTAKTKIGTWFENTEWAEMWGTSLDYTGDIWASAKTQLDTAYTKISEWAGKQDWENIWNDSTKAFGEFRENVITTVSDAVNNSQDKISAALDGINFESVGTNLSSTLTEYIGDIEFLFDSIDFTKMGENIGTAIAGLGDTLAAIDYTELGTAIWEAIKAGVGGFGELLVAIIKASFRQQSDESWFGKDDSPVGKNNKVESIDLTLDTEGLIGERDDLLAQISKVTANLNDEIAGKNWNIFTSQEKAIANLKDLLLKLDSEITRVNSALQSVGVSAVPSGVDVASFASGGHVSGSGTGTSDSIPAMLSNGEFVMNARSAKVFAPLLEAMNAQKFAKGGMVGTVVQRYADGGSATTGKSYQFLQFEDGLFSMAMTMDKFIGEMDQTSPAVQEVISQLNYLEKHTGNLNEDQVLAHDYATRVNAALINLLPKKKEEAEVTEDAAGAVKDLGDAAKNSANTIAKEKNEWEGTAQSFTGPIKSALANGGDIGDAFKQGVKGLMSNIIGKLLDKAFAPLEAGIDNFLNTMSSGGSGGGGFLSGLFGGGGGGAMGGGGSGRIVSQLFGGMMMSTGGIVPKPGQRPQYFAHGGMAKGTDTVPAMLTPGEMVLTKEQQQAMMGKDQKKSGDTYNFNIEATDAESFKRMLSQDPKFLSSVAEQGRQAKSGLRRAR